MQKLSDINLEEELSRGVLRTGTRRSYDTWLRKFSESLGIVWDPVGRIPKELLTDENIAKFLVALGSKSNYTPHSLKSARAAISSCLLAQGIKCFNDSANYHEWPLTLQAIKVRSAMHCHFRVLFKAF